MNGKTLCLKDAKNFELILQWWGDGISRVLKHLCSILNGRIENVFILFDDDDGLYEAGQMLTGKIVVTVISVAPIREIRLTLLGVMRPETYLL